MSKISKSINVKRLIYIIVPIIFLLFLLNFKMISTFAFKDGNDKDTINSDIADDKENQDSLDGENTEEEPVEVPEIIKLDFSGIYSDIEGVLTFRGNNFRTTPAYGIANIAEKRFEEMWEFKTGGTGMWGGGAGWTGQPALVKWKKEVLDIMNVKEEFKNDPNFVEVILGSLDGKIYFLDLKTGKPSRNPIDTGNPIKGSVSVDSRGYPMLYVGQGIKEKEKIGFYLYSLIDQKELHFQSGKDEKAPRGWPAFDSSALFYGDLDLMFVAGENGLIYKIKLNTDFSIENKTIKITPEIKKYANKGSSGLGTENSMSAFENQIFYADNCGRITSLDLDLNEIWTIKNLDDTDASITIDVEDGIPFLYTGCEVDRQGTTGISRILKINGKTGEIIWQKDFKCYNQKGGANDTSNGGVITTNIVGKNKLKDIVVFTVNRYPINEKGIKNGGIMVAFNKATGEEVWRWKLPTYAWPSPVDVYDSEGNGYIIHTARSGSLHLIEGLTGKEITNYKLDKTMDFNYTEASPAVFNDVLVIASRTPSNKIYGVKLK